MKDNKTVEKGKKERVISNNYYSQVYFTRCLLEKKTFIYWNNLLFEIK